FQYTSPFALIASWIFCGCVILGVLDARGRSTFTACVSSGAVMMKITSSTSMTSISGTMLISAMGALELALLNPPNAITLLLGLRADAAWAQARREARKRARRSLRTQRDRARRNR